MFTSLLCNFIEADYVDNYLYLNILRISIIDHCLEAVADPIYRPTSSLILHPCIGLAITCADNADVVYCPEKVLPSRVQSEMSIHIIINKYISTWLIDHIN
jgi:hypothetical protein